MRRSNRPRRSKLAALIAFVFGFAAILPAAATDIPDKDWEYERLDDDHVVIHNADQSRRKSAIDPDTAGDIAVPASLRNMQVVSIGEKAFYNCSKLTSVVIPEGVTNIADNAFYGCTSLTNVVFPASLKSIGTYGLYNCGKLAAVNFKGASLTIGSHAFRDCSSIATLRFSGDLVSFGDRAFSGCTGLRDVSLSAKTIAIGERAFSYYDSSACVSLADIAINATNLTLGALAFDDCTSLTNAVLVGSSSAAIGESAFSGCTSLRSVALPVALTDVATNAFYQCKALEGISFSTNVTHISYRAFDTCTSLRDIGFAEGLKSIDVQAFYGCTSVTNLTFPRSLASVGDRAFERCDGLAEARFQEGTKDVPAAQTVKIGERTFYQCSALANVTLPQALVSTGERAFSQCTALTRVNLPTNFEDIAVSAFEDCAALPTIDLPVTLKSIGNSAFYGCTSLTGFLIPTNNVVALGSKVFNNTKYWNDQPDGLVVNNGYLLGFKGNPTKVTLPPGCKAIPVAMFEGMSNVVEVVIPDSVTLIGARAFAGSGIASIAFAGVTTMGNSAFEGCASLASVSLSSVLTAIPGNAFKDCTALLSIAVPDSVASIDEYAFYNCRSLTTVSGAAGVTKVGDYAFAQCPALQPFQFPNDVAYGEHVFQGCTWTEHVLFPKVGTLRDEYPATYAKIRSIVFSSSMSVITNDACAGCASLESVRIPAGVTAIGERAFYGCTSLASVEMSASVTSVATNSFKGCTGVTSATVSGAVPVATVFPETYAAMAAIGIASDATSLQDGLFAGCAALSSVEIPWRVTSIGARAFYGCSNLTDSVMVPEYVTAIGEQAFGRCYGLKSVDYLCEMPDSVADDVYAGTRLAMMSKVLPQYVSWQTGTNSASASILPSEWKSRPIVWWASVKSRLATVRFSSNDNRGGGTSRYFLANAGRQILELPDAPERENYTFLGWFTEPYGGVEITDGVDVGGSVTYYAHWQKDDEDVPSEYDFSRAQTYNGYLTDGEAVVGSVQFTFAKGKWDKSEEETNAVATAKLQLLGEGSLTAKGVLHEDGSGSLSHAKSERTLEVEAGDANTLTGSFDGYGVVAYRDLFASPYYDDKVHANAMLGAAKGKYVVVLAATGDTPSTVGYAALSVVVGAKGSVKVTGTMPDGAKVSATAQLLVLKADETAEDVGVIPVVAPLYSKKGGFGFQLTFEPAEGGGNRAVTLSGVSSWIADKAGTAVPLADVGVQPVRGLEAGEHAFGTDLSSLSVEGVEIVDELSPAGTVFSATAKKWTLPKADTVRFYPDEGYVITKDNGNPAALKLTYASGTGMFKGSFKVFGITEAGKSKTYTATVNGGIVGGVGYGTATVKKAGSVPVVID